MAKTYDAIVVGSGISGGWAAKELTQKGLDVLLLERGKNVEHIKDYVNARKAPWEYPHRGGRTYAMEEAYPVLKRDYPLNEKNLDWWASDRDSPYTEIKRFDWYRGYQVGGRSLLWGRHSYRLGDLDFEANARDGVAVDWPIRYADLAPWYSHVERHAGIAGSVEGMPQYPDGEFMPPIPLNCAEELVAERVRGEFGGKRRIVHARVANITRPLPGRAPCQYRNACWLGCPYGASFSSQSSTLPAAMATNRLTLKPWSIVTELVYNKDTQRVSGVRVLDAVSETTTEYNAKIVFLCASTLNSAWLLMRSATDVCRRVSVPAPVSWAVISWTTIFVLALRAASTIRLSTTSTTSAAGPPASTFRVIETWNGRIATTCAGLATRAARIAKAGGVPCRSWVSARNSRTRCPGPATGRSARPHSARCCRTRITA